MKAFHFRLDQALRWRATQLDIEKAHTAEAARRLAAIQTEIENLRVEMNRGAAELTRGVAGSTLAVWSAYTDRSARRIRDLEAAAKEAEQALAARIRMLTTANQKLKLLENLRGTGLNRWQAEFNKELDAFAGESHLFRLHARERRTA